MFDWLDMLVTASFWVAVLRISTPLIFGTLGELICERAGVLNLGIEGIMVAGAFSGWLAVYLGAPLPAGILVAMAVGAALGLLHGILTVALGLSQHVAGIGVTLLATSLSYYFYRMVFPTVTEPPRIEPFQPLDLPGLFAQTPMTYLAFVMVALTAYVLYRTPLGLAVRMVGENPAAVEAQGIDVTRLRIGAVMAGSSLMALGGAFLTLSAFNAFYFNMINGRGWICVALVVFASWRPGKALLGAVLFAAFDAFQLRLQQLIGGAVPYQFFLMAPYVLSILALIVMSRRAGVPRALMIPYRKGER
jgi:simple sugar transport system permease protein